MPIMADHHMTLGKLAALCLELIAEEGNGLDENTRVALSSDSEGNSYGFMQKDGYGTAVLTDEYHTEMLSGDDGEYLDPTDTIPEDAVAAVIFYP